MLLIVNASFDQFLPRYGRAELEEHFFDMDVDELLSNEFLCPLHCLPPSMTEMSEIDESSCELKGHCSASWKNILGVEEIM